MPRDLKLYLWDIVRAGENIEEFIGSKTFADYENDPLTRSAVERCFGVIGEALNQARSLYPGLKDEIQEHKQIVNFRNRIVHGYFAIDEENIWSIAKVYLPALLQQVRSLIVRIDTGAAPADLSVAVFVVGETSHE